MGDKSQIEWTDATWNPMSGCTKISAGCKNCYAERMARRLKAMGQHRYRNGFKVTLHGDDVIEQPIRWRKPRMVFVCSMGDLFHVMVPDDFIRRVFEVMEAAPQHTFQVLTKRSERLADLAPSLPWPRNVWAGVTVENRGAVERIRHLASVPAAVRFLSMEPLLEWIPGLPLLVAGGGVNWVIAGGESGPGARPLPIAAARLVRETCRQTHTPFFFKQWGGVRKHENGCELDGREWKEMPKV